jgi:putative phage-type endonuclease
MKLNKLVSTAGMPHEEWLQYRKKGIGGSDAGAICGVNKYRSAVSVFLDKTTAQVSEYDNEAMRQGRDLEQYVAERFCEETGKKVRRANAIFVHSEIPFMFANVDRMIVGEKAGLECKTASAFSADKWADGSIPPEYEVQCNHYMAVTGADAWYIACVILGKEFIWHRIERDEELIATIEELEKDFWQNNVIANVMPAPDGSSSVDSYINSRYADSDPEQSVDITTYDGALKRREEITILEKKLGVEKKQIEQEVKQYMQEAETAYSNSYEVKWKTVESKRVDTKKLKSEYPEVYKDCINVGTSRRFTVKGIA